MENNLPSSSTGSTASSQTNGKKDAGSELTEEDRLLVEQLQLLVDRLHDSDPSIIHAALDGLAHAIKNATTSMTSVPKPIKFLKGHYELLRQFYSKKSLESEHNQTKLSDILSVLSMAYGEEDKHETLYYRLNGGSAEPPGAWGHEYVSHLAMEIMREYEKNLHDHILCNRLQLLASELIPFFLSHNAEADACDLAAEVEILPILSSFVDLRNYERITLYLSSCVNYEATPDDQNLLRVVHEIYRKVNDLPKAILVSMRLGDLKMIEGDFSVADRNLKRQLAFMLARERIIPTLSVDEIDEKELISILTNSKLSHFYSILASEFKVIEPKSPEDVYKRHLENPGRFSSLIVSADPSKEELASIFVNGLLNAGFGTDKLILGSDGETRMFQTKKDSLFCNVASIGLMHLWNVEVALSHLDKFLESGDPYVKAGALFAVGIVSCNVENEAEPALALLSEELISSSDQTVRMAAVLGLGIAYIGTKKESLLPVLLSMLDNCFDTSNENTTLVKVELLSITILSLGLIFAGTGLHSEISSSIIQSLMVLGAKDLESPFIQLALFGLSFLFLSTGFDENKSEDTLGVILESIRVLPHAGIVKQAEMLLLMMSYAGSGNVLKIQECISILSNSQECENKDVHEQASSINSSGDDNSKKASTSGDNLNGEEELFESISKDSIIYHRPYAVLSLAVIAMGEELGSEMCFRLLSRLMHYGDASVRSVVPLAMALLSVSAPKTTLMETLSKYSHDHDLNVAMSAILGLGIIGAGTNNSRLAMMLRSLASYYARDGHMLFGVRLAQGLVHAGKGILHASPLHSHKSLLCKPALMGLISFLFCTSSMGTNIVLPNVVEDHNSNDTSQGTSLAEKCPMLLYLLVPALYPRFLMTLDAETLDPIPISVRVGQAVDVVGQAGRPKTITGFQTHSTPVILSYSERAELASDVHIPLTPVLEGIVLLDAHVGNKQHS